MGYVGQTIKGIVENFNCVLEIVKRPHKWFRIPGNIENVNQYLQERGIDISGGFKVLPRRWVVERTFAWINRYRRMSKEYEYLCATSETMIYATMVKTMLRRLSKKVTI